MSSRGKSWVIANGAQISSAPVIVESYDRLIGAKWPATMTSTHFGFKVSDDRSDSSPKVQQWEGADISLDLAQGKSTNFDPAYLAGHFCVWLTVDAAEGDERTVLPNFTEIR